MGVESSAQIRYALSRKCALAGIPVSGTFELTPRCNLGCRMCYVRLTKEEMKPLGKERTKEEWIDLAKQAKEAGMIFLLLTGGEPLLRDDFVDIYRELSQMGFSISINSNGTLWNDAVKEVMHEFPPSQVNITLYGLSTEDYLKLCGDKRAYDRVMDTLHWLKSEHILTHLNTTMTPENLHLWKDFEDFAINEDLELRMTTYCFPPVRRALCPHFERLSAEDAGELTVKDMLYREGKEALKQRLLETKSPLNSCKLDTGEPIQCMAARSQFWVNWNGTMTPCGMLDRPVVHPFETGFSISWENLKKESSLIRLCPECSACEHQKFCMNCAAVTFTETGRFDGKPEYMCRFNQSYRDALKKYSE